LLARGILVPFTVATDDFQKLVDRRLTRSIRVEAEREIKASWRRAKDAAARIADEDVEWAIVNRLKAMLDAPPKRSSM
jgi:hypothetical protein